MRNRRESLSRWLRGRPARPDPFRTLELQDRLSRLSRELTELGGNRGDGFASGFHARAALMAYDRTLVDACRLAGLGEPELETPADRVIAEAELTNAGWSW